MSKMSAADWKKIFKMAREIIGCKDPEVMEDLEKLVQKAHDEIFPEEVKGDDFIVLFEDPYADLQYEVYPSALKARKACYEMQSNGVAPVGAYRKLKDYKL